MDIITSTEMYWLLKLDDIRGLFIAVAVFTAIAGGITTIARMVMCGPLSEDTDESLQSRVRKASNLTLIAAFVFGMIATFLPSTKQYAAIKVIPLILNSDALKQVAADASDLYSLGIKGLKEALTEATKDKQD
jgi:dihydroorotase-like cyclic amidohydrolase